jgi:hypothetical protein
VATYVEPFQDAWVGFPRIAELIKQAQQFVHVVTWGLDDELRLAGDSQQPILYSRTRNHLRFPDQMEDLRCALSPAVPGVAAPVDALSITYLLRWKAAQLAWAQEQPLGKAAAIAKSTAKGQVMVLVWHNEVDDEWSVPVTVLDDLAYLMVNRDHLTGWSSAQLHQYMRSRGSGESMVNLLSLQSLYRSPFLDGVDEVPMPTGVCVMTDPNLNYVIPVANIPTSSHHQKFVVSDAGTYIGGLNLLKEYWDTSLHKPSVDPNRTSSGTITSFTFRGVREFGSDQGPLHDTGTIIHGDLESDVHKLFVERWATCTTNWHKAKFRGGLTPYGRVREKVQELYESAAKSDPSTQTALTALLDELQRMELDPLVQIPFAPSPNPPGMPKPLQVSNEIFRVSRPVLSFNGSEQADEIRQTYNAVIAKQAGNFFYFENQYFEDHDFFETLWDSLPAKKARTNLPGSPTYQAPDPPRPVAQLNTQNWSPGDPQIFAVLPYRPAGATGIEFFDDWTNISQVITRETKNFLWLQIKTARAVYVRNNLQMPYMDFRDLTGTCPGAQHPYIEFEDWQVDSDPENLTLNSWVIMYGNLVSANPVLCPPQDAARFRVSQLIPVSSFIPYCLVNSGEAFTNAGGQPPVDPVLYDDNKRYNDYCRDHMIYVHSKHSELGLATNTPTFVFGSANINPRSLGVVRAPNEAQDSECAVFYTPATRRFWQSLWFEHLGEQVPLTADPGADLGQAQQTWVDEGWSNLLKIRTGGWPDDLHRVVQIDAWARAFEQGVLF